MRLESIIVTSKKENRKDGKIFKCEITVTKSDDIYELRLDGFYPDQPLRPYPISLKPLADAEIENQQSEYKDVSYPTDDFGYKQECFNVECSDSPYGLIFEILNQIKIKIGDFDEISFKGGSNFLELDRLKEQYPEIQVK